MRELNYFWAAYCVHLKKDNIYLLRSSYHQPCYTVPIPRSHKMNERHFCFVTSQLCPWLQSDSALWSAVVNTRREKNSHNLSVVWLVKKNSKPYVTYVHRLSALEISTQSNGAKHQKVKKVALLSYAYDRSAGRSSGNMISEMDQFGSQ